MIVSLWLAYIAARKGTSVHIPTNSAPDGPVVEVDALATVSWCLRKGEEMLSRLFRRVLEIWAELQAEPQAEPPAEPQAEPPAEPQAEPAAAPPASQQAGGPSPQGDAGRGVQAHGQVLVEDRMNVQYLRWSQTRVHRVSSLLEDELVEDRKEQTENGVSQVLLQGMPETLMDAVMEAITVAVTDTEKDTETDSGTDTGTDTGMDSMIDPMMDLMMDPMMDSTHDTNTQVQFPNED